MTKIEADAIIKILNDCNLTVKIKELDEDGDWNEIQALDESKVSNNTNIFQILIQ